MKRASFVATWLLISGSTATAFAQAAPAPEAPPPAEPETASAPEAAAAPEPAPPPESSKPEREDTTEVRIIGSKPDAIQKIPGSGYLISEKDFKRTQPLNAGEMLRRVPGVQVRDETGGGNRIDISIRGQESGRSRRVLLLEDGVPMALNPYSEPDMYYSPPVERMRGIEVVKGSGNILFGPNTTGGVINFITVLPPPGQQVMLDAEGGDRGYFRGMARYGDAFGSARYMVQAFHKRGDGFRDVSFNQTDVLGKMAIDTSKDSELMVKLGFHDEDDQSDAIGLTRAMYEENPRRSTIAPNDRMFLRRYDLSITHEQRFSANTKLRTLLYAYRLDRTWRRQDWTRTPVPGDDYERVVGNLNLPNDAVYFKNTNTVLDRSYETAGLEPRFEHRFATGSVSHTLDLGGRLLIEGANYAQGAGTNPTTYAGSSDYKEHHLATAAAAYVQDRIAFRDDLMVTPGVRFEAAHYSRTIDRQNTGTGPKDVAITGEVNPWAFIPGIGVTYGSKALNVFGGEHIGWAPPRLTNAVSPRGTPAQTSSEFSTNFEAGIRTAPRKWLRAEGAGFLTVYKNQVVSTSGGAGAQSELADAGPTNIAGVESMLALGLGSLFHWATIVDVGARYTYSRATFSSGPYDGHLLPYAPLHSFNANLDIEHPSGFGGQIAYNFVSDQFTDQANTRQPDATGNLGLIPARNIVDFTAHYKHKPTGLSLRFTVKNATDEVYIWARRPNGIFASGFRQFVLGLKWEFDGPSAN